MRRIASLPDIFEPAMHNLFDTASIVIAARSEGELYAAPGIVYGNGKRHHGFKTDTRSVESGPKPDPIAGLFRAPAFPCQRGRDMVYITCIF